MLTCIYVIFHCYDLLLANHVSKILMRYDKIGKFRGLCDDTDTYKVILVSLLPHLLI